MKKFVSLISLFSMLICFACSLQKQQKNKLNEHSKVFIYKNTSDIKSFYCSLIEFKNDSLFSFSFYSNENYSNYTINEFKSEARFYEMNNMIFKDTLIKLSLYKIYFINNTPFIDTNLQMYSDSLVFDHKVYFQNKNSFKKDNYLEMKIVDVNLSDGCCFSYKFDIKSWVIEYNFGENKTYKLIETGNDG